MIQYFTSEYYTEEKKTLNEKDNSYTSTFWKDKSRELTLEMVETRTRASSGISLVVSHLSLCKWASSFHIESSMSQEMWPPAAPSSEPYSFVTREERGIILLAWKFPENVSDWFNLLINHSIQGHEVLGQTQLESRAQTVARKKCLLLEKAEKRMMGSQEQKASIS